MLQLQMLTDPNQRATTVKNHDITEISVAFLCSLLFENWVETLNYLLQN